MLRCQRHALPLRNQGAVVTEFGEIVGKRLQELGISQRDLAPLVGLDATQINKLVKGRRPPPRDARKILAMVRALRFEDEAARNFVVLAGLSPEILSADTGPTASAPSRVHDPNEIGPAKSGIYFDRIDNIADESGRADSSLEYELDEIMSTYDLPFAERALIRHMAHAAARGATHELCRVAKETLNQRGRL